MKYESSIGVAEECVQIGHSGKHPGLFYYLVYYSYSESEELISTTRRAFY